MQAQEDVFCQDEKLLGFFKAFHNPITIAYQHFFIVPLCLLFSRTGIMVDGYINFKETHLFEILGGVIHFIWMLTLFSYLEHPWPAYFMTTIVQGTLALQLLGNHYWKPWVEINDQKYVSFPKRQVEVNANYKCSRWMDWLYGGLHFHNEHHSFPCLPRN
jgi:delta8-fatty-acid desaturase